MRATFGTAREYFSVPVVRTARVRDGNYSPGRKAGPREPDPMDRLTPAAASARILGLARAGRAAELLGEGDDDE